jgi:hypothetical protein
MNAVSPAKRPDETQPQTPAEEQIQAAVESEGQGADALVYRADPSTGKEAFLDRVSAEMISSEWLGKEYGGGKYRVQFRKPGPNGGNVYARQQRYEVDPAIPPKPPRWARTPAASGDVRNADGSPAGASPGMDAVLSSGILSLFQQQQENSRMQADWFRSTIESKSKSPNIVEILVAAAPILAIVKELFQSRAVVAPTTPAKDPIELAKELLELRGTPVEGKGAVAQLKEVLELRELLSGLGGAADAEDPMIKLIGMLGPQIIDAIKNAQTIDATKAAGTPATTSRSEARAVPPARELAQPPRVVSPASEPAPAAQPTTQSEGASAMDMATFYIGQRLPKIIKLAEAGKNPDLYAQLEEDILPEAFKDAAREFVSQENFIDKIFEAYPHLNAHHDWMEDFFDTFAAALLGELEVDDDEEIGPLGAAAEEEVIEVEGVVSETPASPPPASDNGTVE